MSFFLSVHFHTSNFSSNSNFTPLYYSTLGSDTSNQTITSSMNTSCSLHWNWGQPTLGSPTPTLTLSLFGST